LKACKLAVHLLGKQGQHHRVLPKKDRLPNMGFLLNPLKTKSFINEKGPGETEPSFLCLHCIEAVFTLFLEKVPPTSYLKCELLNHGANIYPEIIYPNLFEIF
jgi:hypothetical protein